MKAFADLIGITQGALSGIESGKSKPSSDTLSSIVLHTNINPFWLLIGKGKMYAESQEVVAAERNGTTDVLTRKHVSLVKKFEDPESAVSINEKLLILEKLNPAAFRKMDGYLSGLIDGIKMSQQGGAGAADPAEPPMGKQVNGK